jgi:ABC-type branched-subunit amino acid transport system substrate-binding protein
LKTDNSLNQRIQGRNAMKRRWLGLVSLLAALSLVIAACGDDDTADTTAATTADTTTTAAPATTEAPDTGPDYAFDVGVTPAPCSDAVNEGNACIYLGVISDLTDGPFSGLAPRVTTGQEDFWGAINAAGGLDGFDVIISPENTFDHHYSGDLAVEGYEGMKDRVLALAQLLGTPPTEALLPRMIEDDIVAAPATWWSGLAFSDRDSGLILESGGSYCVEAMNGMFAMTEDLGTDLKWGLVTFQGDYGQDYGEGAKIAAAELELGDPVVDVFVTPMSVGGDPTVVIPEIAQAAPDLIVMAVGPREMATIVGGLFQAGLGAFAVMGAGPTWDVALLGNADLVPLLQAVYFTTGPWGNWDFDSQGHQDARAAAAANERLADNAYLAGWTWQYPLKALLEQVIASGDLTRTNMAATALDLTGVSYDGILPDRDYTGSADGNIVRSSLLFGVDPTTSDGLVAKTPVFTSAFAQSYGFAAPCIG